MWIRLNVLCLFVYLLFSWLPFPRNEHGFKKSNKGPFLGSPGDVLSPEHVLC